MAATDQAGKLDAFEIIGDLGRTFRVLKIIQKGGQGTFYLAENRSTHKQVGIKRFHVQNQRFEDEVIAATLLADVDNVPRVLDVRRDPPCIVYQYIAGNEEKNTLRDI